jgi:hypothetical protein
VPFVELKLCEKTGKILIEAKKLYKCNDFNLVIAWLNSNIFLEIISGNEVYCSQAKTYVARCFIEETIIGDSAEKVEIADDVLFWFGYLVCYWCFSKDIVPKVIAQIYDIRKILDAYDVLHSLCIRAAIEKIMEEYRL